MLFDILAVIAADSECLICNAVGGLETVVAECEIALRVEICGLDETAGCAGLGLLVLEEGMAFWAGGVEGYGDGFAVQAVF